MAYFCLWFSISAHKKSSTNGLPCRYFIIFQVIYIYNWRRLQTHSNLNCETLKRSVNYENICNFWSVLLKDVKTEMLTTESIEVADFCGMGGVSIESPWCLHVVRKDLTPISYSFLKQLYRSTTSELNFNIKGHSGVKNNSFVDHSE